MNKTVLSSVLMIAIIITPLTVFADDVQIDSNGNVKTGVSNPGGYGNLDVTGASGEHAVRGVTSGTGAAGVYGMNNDGSGYGGYFEGNARVTGNLMVDGTFSAPGLDADTLDGSHASAFANSTHSHSGADITTGTVGEARIDALITRDTELNAHMSRTDNPHSVTAAQTGAASSTHNHDVRYYDKAYVDALEARIAALEALLAHLSRSGNDLYITGANLHIVNGSGATGGTVNGLGNLIVGYNELRGTSDDRSGSHNIVLGRKNNYTSYGGLVAGEWNVISGPFATVSGGSNNTASGDFSSISSGRWNIASNEHAGISGGFYNEATNIGSSVSGGVRNTASGVYAGVSGGASNTASGDYSSVSGGSNNKAEGQYSFIGGGGGESDYDGNVAFADYSAILGGLNNLTGDGRLIWNGTIGRYVLAGNTDHTIGRQTTVSGGATNMAYNNTSSISGGYGNMADGTGSNISGGLNNKAIGDYSGISGGANNEARGNYSFIGGGGNSNSAYGNKTYANYSTILGGEANVTGNINDKTIGEYSAISGGNANSATARSSSVSGGRSNAASGWYSTVSGGNSLSATATDQWKSPGH